MRATGLALRAARRGRPRVPRTRAGTVRTRTPPNDGTQVTLLAQERECSALQSMPISNSKRECSGLIPGRSPPRGTWRVSRRTRWHRLWGTTPPPSAALRLWVVCQPAARSGSSLSANFIARGQPGVRISRIRAVSSRFGGAARTMSRLLRTLILPKPETELPQRSLDGDAFRKICALSIFPVSGGIESCMLHAACLVSCSLHSARCVCVLPAIVLLTVYVQNPLRLHRRNRLPSTRSSPARALLAPACPGHSAAAASSLATAASAPPPPGPSPQSPSPRRAAR